MCVTHDINRAIILTLLGCKIKLFRFTALQSTRHSIRLSSWIMVFPAVLCARVPCPRRINNRTPKTVGNRAQVFRSGETCDLVSKFNFVENIELSKSIKNAGKLGVALSDIITEAES